MQCDTSDREQLHYPATDVKMGAEIEEKKSDDSECYWADCVYACDCVFVTFDVGCEFDGSAVMKTLFLPYFPNKTTLVAGI